MKKLILVLTMMLLSSTIFAKQKVEYFRYTCVNVARACKDDLDALIDKGYKIISFSLYYGCRCMVVVYEE